MSVILVADKFSDCSLVNPSRYAKPASVTLDCLRSTKTTDLSGLFLSIVTRPPNSSITQLQWVGKTTHERKTKQQAEYRQRCSNSVHAAHASQFARPVIVSPGRQGWKR